MNHKAILLGIGALETGVTVQTAILLRVYYVSSSTRLAVCTRRIVLRASRAGYLLNWRRALVPGVREGYISSDEYCWFIGPEEYW